MPLTGSGGANHHARDLTVCQVVPRAGSPTSPHAAYAAVCVAATVMPSRDVTA
jgi:hypothetical protein